jgi:predicted nucleic acid-binding protein
MSDTLETDAEVNELKSATTYNMVWAEFARKLERERDEAIKAIKSANAYKRVLKNENARLRRMLNLPENDERIRGDADA